MSDPDVRAAIDAAWQAQLQEWERERQEQRLARELAWRLELARQRARLFR